MKKLFLQIIGYSGFAVCSILLIIVLLILDFFYFIKLNKEDNTFLKNCRKSFNELNI